MSRAPHRVLIVGAGLTGSVIACQLKRLFKHNISITVWEKSRGAGGRMNTNRCSPSSILTCDLGAQYISVTPDYYVKHERFYDELLKSDVIKPFAAASIVGEVKYDEEGTLHYVAPLGINRVVKHFLFKSGSDVVYDTLCEEINFKNKCWEIYSEDRERCCNADTIIFTIPIPQLLKLKGSVPDLLESCRTQVERVQYSSRYALAMYFDKRTECLEIPYTCMYVKDNDCVRFISFDTAKRMTDPQQGTSLLIHTSIPFGIKHLEEDFDIVEPIIMHHVKSLLPNLPSPSSTKCLRWRYSQVSEPFPDSPGCIVLSRSPLIIASGDGFTHSNFSGCIESALATVDKFNIVVGEKLIAAAFDI